MEHDKNNNKNNNNQLLAEFNAFKQRKDSLRLPASRVAAVSGYHPFQSLPQLFCDLVYQSRLGHKLLKHDAMLLGVQLLSEDTVLLELAKKASKETFKALQSALLVKDGSKVLITSNAASDLKSKILKEAQRSKKLKKQELAVLVEGARSSVDTGYGRHHENEALDLYEKQCGWEVRERNVAVLSWPFRKERDTIVPMRKPKEYFVREDSCTRRSKAENENYGKEESSKPPTEDNKTPKEEAENERPFLTISGAVDGIRDELFCPANSQASDINEEWQLRRIIVECKHRMRQVMKQPSLYDQIQATVYCLMYDTDEADLVQVMRKSMKKESSKQLNKRKRTEADKDDGRRSDSKSQGVRITEFFGPEDQIEEKRDKSMVEKNDGGAEGNKEDEQQTTVPTSFRQEVRDSTSSELLPESVEVGERDENDPPGADSQTSDMGERGTTKSKPSAEPNQIGNCERSKSENPVELVGQQIDLTVDEASSRPFPTDEPSIEIFVSRVSLDDPLMQHRQNWQSVVLPRLHSFVEAVYRVRGDDTKRYALLNAIAQKTTFPKAGWDIVHEECPWLRECDTAYNRECFQGRK